MKEYLIELIIVLLRLQGKERCVRGVFNYD